MGRNRLASVLGFLMACASMEGAIPLNSLQTFDLLPPVEDWATYSAGGGGPSIISPENLDVAIQTNQVAAITNLLRETSGGTFGLAQWHLTGRYVQTRPGGVAYQVLLATIQNTSGKNLASLAVAYDFGNPSSLPLSEDPGLNGVRAYYSLTGQPNSWSLIPELTTSQTGNVAAVIVPGAWPAGSLLYVMWADDNGGPATDSAFTIDNFIAMESLPPPPPPRVDPLATNVVCGDTIRLAAIVYGFGLSFQWFKDGQLIAPGTNPTAIQPVLVITNAYPSDAGQYWVLVQNAAGGVFSSIIPVQVGCGEPPRLLFAYNMPDEPKGIRVIVEEPLCTDESVCGGDASLVFNWIVESVPSLEERFIDFVEVNPTNLQFTLAEPRAPGETFRIRPADNGSGMSAISDLFGNRMLLGHSITSVPGLLFKQGFNGYSGTQDAEIHSGSLSDSILGAAQTIRIDLDDAGVAQGLLRFGNLIGNELGQLTPGIVIHSATLSLAQVEPGSVVNLRRMLVNWDQGTAAWNSLVNGISADDVEARSSVDAVIVSGATESIDVTASVQAWVNGAANYGWFLESTGTDGFAFASSESAQPPALAVIVSFIERPCVLTSAQLPNTITILEGQSFTLSPNISFEGFCPLTYQWTKNGVNIEGARSITFSVPAATVCDSGNYRIIVSVAGQSVISNPVVVAIPADIVRPVLTRAFGSADGTNITLTFSKEMNPTNAPDLSHYVLDPPLAVTGATLSADGRTVTLTTAPRSLVTSYTLRIQDVTDTRQACAGSIGNVISPNPSFVDITGVTPILPWAAAGNWNYATNDQAANPNWKTGTLGPEWLVGPQFFGFEPSAGITNSLPIQPDPIKTPLQANDTNVLGAGNSEIFASQYFHRQITLPELEPHTLFAVSFYVDDGAIFYLDGVEIGRYQMPTGPVTFSTRSTGGNGEAILQTLLFSASAGTRHLAVEVHQAGVSSSDVLFGLQISKVTVPSTLSIVRDQGTNILSWAADSVWGLTSSQTVNGNYLPVSGNLPRVFHVPPTAQTNNTFYRLQYTP